MQSNPHFPKHMYDPYNKVRTKVCSAHWAAEPMFPENLRETKVNNIINLISKAWIGKIMTRSKRSLSSMASRESKV